MKNKKENSSNKKKKGSGCMKDHRKRFCKGRTVRAPDTASFETVLNIHTNYYFKRRKITWQKEHVKQITI